MNFEKGQRVLVDGIHVGEYLGPDVRGCSRVKFAVATIGPYLFSTIDDCRLTPAGAPEQSGMRAGVNPSK